MEHTFAIPLWALVDREKVDPKTSDLRGLAKQLGRWLEHNHHVQHKGTAIEESDGSRPGAAPLLIVAGVPQIHWPAMLALASAQRCLLYLVIPDADGTPCLRPLSIPRE
jgi:hypothetical protein